MPFSTPALLHDRLGSLNRETEVGEEAAVQIFLVMHISQNSRAISDVIGAPERRRGRKRRGIYEREPHQRCTASVYALRVRCTIARACAWGHVRGVCWRWIRSSTARGRSATLPDVVPGLDERLAGSETHLSRPNMLRVNLKSCPAFQRTGTVGRCCRRLIRSSRGSWRDKSRTCVRSYVIVWFAVRWSQS